MIKQTMRMEIIAHEAGHNSAGAFEQFKIGCL